MKRIDIILRKISSKVNSIGHIW